MEHFYFPIIFLFSMTFIHIKTYQIKKSLGKLIRVTRGTRQNWLPDPLPVSVMGSTLQRTFTQPRSPEAKCVKWFCLCLPTKSKKPSLRDLQHSEILWRVWSPDVNLKFDSLPKGELNLPKSFFEKKNFTSIILKYELRTKEKELQGLGHLAGSDG